MALIARVLGVSLVTSALVAALGCVLLGAATGQAAGSSEYIIPALFLACVGGVIGAVAGAAGDRRRAQRPKGFEPRRGLNVLPGRRGGSAGLGDPFALAIPPTLPTRGERKETCERGERKGPGKSRDCPCVGPARSG